MSELQAWVDKLGHMTTAEIRTLMHQEGITGAPGMANACPLARFLQDKTSTAYVSVGASIISFDERIEEIPDSMLAFVMYFDAENYPELIGP